MMQATEADYFPSELERYLSENIPMASVLGINVKQASRDSVIIGAPLSLNVNHRGTVFGGSASAVAILAGWLLVYVQLRAKAAASNIVIQRNEIRYLTPITCDFEARARLSNGENWCDFLRMLARRKKSRVNVSVDLTCKGALVGEFSGSFVAVADQPFNPVALVGLTTCQSAGPCGADSGRDRS
jgi:thioesterase domain-containing protein